MALVRLADHVNRPSRRPDDEGGLGIEWVHWGLVDGSGWLRVERWVRRRTMPIIAGIITINGPNHERKM